MTVATTRFSSKTTPIPGLLLFDITSIEDERGYYQEKFQQAKLENVGLPSDFKIIQQNISLSKNKGVTRGFHAEPWDKYISVVTGKVFVAYLDLRGNSPTYKKVFTTTINPNQAVFLPQGVANSFQTLEDNTYYIYNVNKLWDANLYDQYCFVRLNDPSLKIDWPISLEKSIINPRDLNHPLVKDIEPL